MTSRDESASSLERPQPGMPRPYTFPSFERSRLDSGLSVISVDLPARPLLAGVLIVLGGAGDDPEAEAGATVLMARALSEGTDNYDAIELVEATERLGASLHAEEIGRAHV